MLIATFGPTTGWVGKTITYENGAFFLQDHGPVLAADVMAYDQQGHLVWANEGMRAWVDAQTAPKAASASSPSSNPKARKRLPPVLVAAVIGIVAFVAIIAVAAAMSSMHSAENQAGGAYSQAQQNTGGGTPTYTLDQFNQLQTGMTQDQVTSILGSGGTMTAQNNLAGTSTEAYSYQNADGGNMQLMFQNGALIQKAQFGLH